MIPADQGFEADDPTGVGVVLDLIVQLELVAGERALEVDRELGADAAGFVHRRLIGADLAAPKALGAIHREVGALGETIGRLAVLGVQRNADAATDRKRLMLPFDGLEHDLAQPFRELDRLAARKDLALHGHEFVATDPSQKFSRLQFRGDALGHLPQQMIAADMAVDVVDVLEAVEIDREHDHACGVVAASGEQIMQLLRQSVAVRQAGQGIVHRLMLVAFGRLVGGLQIDRIG